MRRAAVAALVVMACGGRPPAAPQPLVCPPAVGGAAELLAPGATLVFGEIHGTAQMPAAIGAIACEATTHAPEVVVGLEMSRADQPRLDAYLDSDGGSGARAALLAGAHWDYPDGRSSVAMAALVESLRAWRARGAAIHAVAFDIANLDPTSDPDAREAAMAGALAVARRAHPTAAMIVLTGNLHARLAGGVDFAPDVEWMAQRLAGAVRGLLAFDMGAAEGTAWMCTGPTRDACGVQPIGAGDDTAAPHITREPVVDDKGRTVFVGHLWIGAPTASAPARR
nr:hypothetical protein [Kofleriaceae bacterium]